MKARNLIPGWPRGRSTSRPLRYNRKIAAFFVTDRFFINEAPFFDHGRAALEWADMAIEADENQAEERRKADMMEDWYVQSRRIIWDGFSGHWEWARLVITPYGFGPWEPLGGQYLLSPRPRTGVHP